MIPNVEILLVEDSDNDAELTIRSLRREKIVNHIERVIDGEQALDFLFCRGQYEGRSFAHLPRLVLLDLKMPKVDGLEVLAQIKQNARTRSIPVVVMTSSREQPDIARAYQLGANSYVQKPVDFDQFHQLVKQLGLYWILVNHPPTAGSLNAE